MEGYSVTEAASVLGVPTERVWELLARGVLSGAPDGETGMRVFLQPRPAPAPPERSHAPANGGSHEPARSELSPFRELLTEFRNLTERYGQALLALGEARGEVAALRSRVDLLEARMDLRLPPSGASTGWEPMASVAGPASTPAEPSAPAEPVETEPEVPPAAEPMADVAADEVISTESEARVGRRSASRHAIESFAEALARAEDPSIPELPGGTDAAAALAAMRAGPSDEAASTDDALPREVALADEVPVAEEPAEAVATTVPTDVDAATIPGAPEPVAEEPPPGEQPEPVAELPAEDAEEPMAAEVAEATQIVETPEPTEPIAPIEPGASAWQDERYTAEIGEPDWFEGEAFEPPAPPTPPEEAAIETGEARVATVEPDEEPKAAAGEPVPSEPEPEPQPEPTADAQARTSGDEPAPSEAEPEQMADVEAQTTADEAVSSEPEPGPAAADAPEPTPTPPKPDEPAPVRASPPSMLGRLRPSPPVAAEETMLWFGRRPEGQDESAAAAGDSDEMEVAPTGRWAAPMERAESTEPAEGAPRDLDAAMDALDALSRSNPATAEEPPRDDWSQGPPTRRQPPPTPATRAYRRLRRIFPG